VTPLIRRREGKQHRRPALDAVPHKSVYDAPLPALGTWNVGGGVSAGCKSEIPTAGGFRILMIAR
jgi:hypothetical protein